MKDERSFESAFANKDVLTSLLFVRNLKDVNEVCDQGKTALLWAASADMPDVMVALLDKGANMYAEDRRGYNVLHHAVLAQSHECVRILLEKGMDKTKRSRDGSTAFDLTYVHDDKFCNEMLK